MSPPATRRRGPKGRGRDATRRGPSEIRELVVTVLAQGGAGVAHVTLDAERRAVFVSGSLPGERVRAAVDLSTRPGRGRLLEVVEPSPARVAAACPDVARCGACSMMHVAPAPRRELLAALVREALPATVAPLVTGCAEAAPDLAYRSRARLHVLARRGAVRVGFHAPGTHDPVEVARCAVLVPSVDAARGRLGALFAGADGRGDVHLALGAPRADGAERPVVLDVAFRGELPARYYGALEAAVREGWLAGARTTLEGANRGSLVGDPRPYVAGPDDALLELAVGGFAQASEHGNAALGQVVRTRVEGALAAQATTRRASARPKVLELHAGAGNLTVLLAQGADVTAVESDAEACAAARRNLLARGLAARIVTGDAETVDVPAGTDLVVLDPPRTGAPGAVARLAAKRPRGIVYVSCDARTLARDLAVLLGAGYEATSVDVLDLFPATAHVETVTVLRHPGRRARPTADAP